ncbi:DUF1698 domain-containing protein, partial [Ligilactobacillus salivarius]|nr:DUF1698 domain-containing protein [Ligilactobacillus salivarius]
PRDLPTFPTRRSSDLFWGLIIQPVTTTEEQRRTEWMVTESLADFLDPHDPGKTVEGYPAPKRALLIARKP